MIDFLYSRSPMVDTALDFFIIVALACLALALITATWRYCKKG